MSHTPGPWSVDPYLAHEVRQPMGSKRRRIKCPPDASGFEDAKLVAAAPDLLKAAIAAVNHLRECQAGRIQHPCKSASLPLLEAAIKKATE